MTFPNVLLMKRFLHPSQARSGSVSLRQSMSAPSLKFQKLLAKLRELFELDKADLDFGLYRVLRARRDEIDRFLRDELLPQVREELGVVTEEKIKPLESKVQDEITNVMKYGGKSREEAEASETVVAAKALLEQARNPAALEDEVYSLLTTFFGRYYEAGDFISQRRYSGPGKERYMLPYNGEEVKLVWANMDQYYIKSAENFRDYTFRVPALAPDEAVPEPDTRPRVSFRLIEADTEKDNVKASTGKRLFALADLSCHSLERATEEGLTVLRIPFTCAVRDKDEKQDDLLIAAEAAVLEHANVPGELRKHLSAKAPTATRSDRTVLAKHLEAYAAKNSFDYFIHKDLGGFLSRELDYFLKSEVLRMDDLLTDDDHQRALTLKKARAFKKVAEKIITFLHRQEQFQKKLWLKKKFVISCDYAITLDLIPEDFYFEIAANEAQREEWVKLYAIDEIIKDTTTPGYAIPLSVDFLKAHSSLVLDTRNYPKDFTQRLAQDLKLRDDHSNGVLFNSENFQALSLVVSRYRGKVNCIYIDPPYNTGSDDFLYKDQFQASSWYSMMLDRALVSKDLLSRDGLFFIQIGDEESARSRLWGEAVFAERKNSAVARRGIKNVQAQFDDIDRLSQGHDIIHIFSSSGSQRLPHLYSGLEEGKAGKWDTFWRGTDRKTMRYELFGITPETGQWRWEPGRAKRAADNYKSFLENEARSKSLDEWYAENLQAGVDLDFVRQNNEGVVQYYVPPQSLRLVSDNWLDIPASGTFTDFAHEKSQALLSRVIQWNCPGGGVVLDYFGGSGSTGHACLRASDEKVRDYVMVEMGAHFDETLVPRIKRVVYSPDWKDGKPTTRGKGISHYIKILKLESYEDCLNNLVLVRSQEQDDLLKVYNDLREDYWLGYFLDVETRGSVLKLDRFRDPWGYQMKIATGSVGETRDTAVDLVETFNWLLGLTVQHQSAIQHRRPDKGFSEDQHGRLQLTGGLTRAADPVKDKDSRSFQTIEGTLRGGEKVLVIWRSLTPAKDGDDAARLLEEDNVMLEAFLGRTGLNPREKQWDLIYVNGDHTLDNLAERLADEGQAPRFKVRTIEPEFHRLMFEGTED